MNFLRRHRSTTNTTELSLHDASARPATFVAGVSSESMSHVETVSESIRQQIITGKDVNLASLLIPNVDTGDIRAVHANGIEIQFRNNDPRLTRSLTLGEFLTAFAKYRTVFCEVYPQHRKELDDYHEREIVFHRYKLCRNLVL